MMTIPASTEFLVIGSGAGGTVTALELARAGREVLLLEEGTRHAVPAVTRTAPEAMRDLYRKRGMTPILGKVPIGYVEGCCVGGSTEVNSGFWHRAPREILQRWRSRYDLMGAGESDLEPHYAWAEEQLGVGLSAQPWPASTRVFARGIEAMGWSYSEVPRMAPGCRNSNACAFGCPTGAKQGMSARLVPAAESFGARLLSGCRVLLLLKRGSRIDGVIAAVRGEDGGERVVRIAAEHVIVCAGPTETPALLQRSGIRYHVGNTLRIHPYLKVAAEFPEVIDAEHSVLPLLQVKEFWPELSFGGAFYTLGFLAVTLSENWPAFRHAMKRHRHMAHFYVGVRGSGAGSVRASTFGGDSTLIRYDLSDLDAHYLGIGLARLSAILLAAGARAVYPSCHGLEPIRTEIGATRWLDEPLPKSGLGLVTVHAFSSCPIGERRERCAADSFGRVYGFDQLHVNDASMLPDSPGVNPQGTVMALARRNVLHLIDQVRRRRATAGGRGEEASGGK